MPARDTIHNIVKEALIKDGWEITNDPYVMSYGERFLVVDLAAAASEVNNKIEGRFIGAKRENTRIAIEIKEFRGVSPIADLEQALGQYILYRLLLGQVDPERIIYLAVPTLAYNGIFSEPIGELAITEIPLNLVVIDLEKIEVQQWIT